MNYPTEEQIELLHDSCEGFNTYKIIDATFDLIKQLNPEPASECLIERVR